MCSNAWLQHAWLHLYLHFYYILMWDGNGLYEVRLCHCEKSIFCSPGFTVLYRSWAVLSENKVGKILHICFFQQWAFKTKNELTAQADVFIIHILESMMETLTTFLNSFSIAPKCYCLVSSKKKLLFMNVCWLTVFLHRLPGRWWPNSNYLMNSLLMFHIHCSKYDIGQIVTN